MTNQPLIAGMGGYIGVDFTLFEPICNAYGVPHTERSNLLEKVIVLNKISGDFWRSTEKERQEQEELERRKKER